MKAIVVLSHLMEVTGELNEESQARANLACDILDLRNDINFILTIGWAYREDLDLPVAIAVRNYLLSRGVDEKTIKSDINSRDTVGDAIFSKINFVDIYNIKQLLIVTSDYHVNRVKQIFKRILPIDIEVYGCRTDNSSSLDFSEKASLFSFYKTFKKTNFQSNDSLLETLKLEHPFYNGQQFNKINKNPLPLL